MPRLPDAGCFSQVKVVAARSRQFPPMIVLCKLRRRDVSGISRRGQPRARQSPDASTGALRSI
jgi:hypothetical protein